MWRGVDRSGIGRSLGLQEIRYEHNDQSDFVASGGAGPHAAVGPGSASSRRRRQRVLPGTGQLACLTERSLCGWRFGLAVRASGSGWRKVLSVGRTSGGVPCGPEKEGRKCED